MKTLIKNYKLLFVLALVTSFLSCSSDDDAPAPPPEPTTAELLAHKWFLVKQVDLSQDPPIINIANDCEKNSYLDFHNDGNINLEFFELNGTSCTSLNIQTGTYSLNSDENQILATGDSNTQIWPISTLTQSELVISLNGNTNFYFER